MTPDVREGGSIGSIIKERRGRMKEEKEEENGGRRRLCSGRRLERMKIRHDVVEIGRHDVVKQQPALARREKEACFFHAT